MARIDPRVLIIHDQEDSAAVLAGLLRGRALDVRIARDPDDGFRMAVTCRPAVVLLDLAGMAGFEACRNLKGDSRTAGVPVIFLSDCVEPDCRLRSFESGAADCIGKPYSDDELLARLRVHIHCKQQVDRLHSMLGQRAVARAGEDAFPDDRLFAEALAVLEGRISDPPGIIELAERLGASERKLTEIFRRRVGMTIFDYFSELRLESARRLLETSGMQIQAIASHVGYRNPGDFTRAYRRRYGISPREHRQSARTLQDRDSV